ncbi:hypothetical protein WHR41_01876 [Cladosporium halotolerans]|uniref:Uncharacterized protein n=1 Tax=Cladosporium halotolerans TaxID=1052096 RepID=A0AB34L0U3_9PEZI
MNNTSDDLGPSARPPDNDFNVHQSSLHEVIIGTLALFLALATLAISLVHLLQRRRNRREQRDLESGQSGTSMPQYPPARRGSDTSRAISRARSDQTLHASPATNVQAGDSHISNLHPGQAPAQSVQPDISNQPTRNATSDTLSPT